MKDTGEHHHDVDDNDDDEKDDYDGIEDVADYMVRYHIKMT